MEKQDTLFILGAGASKPYGYPTGAELRTQIINEFRNLYHMNTIRYINNQVDRDIAISNVNNFITRFDESSTKSIDLFLSRNPKDLDLGMLAILLSIFHSELSSISREAVNREEDWYFYLFNRLTQDFTKPDQYKISNHKVSFITFNYDRSLEDFLYKSMTNSFSQVNIGDILDEIKKLNVLHVFGMISRLPWQDSRGIEYGKDSTKYQFTTPVENIKLIYGETDEPVIKELQNRIKNAINIFFLGFGYAKENLEILNFPDIIQPGQKVFGTTKGLKPREVNDIREKYFSTDKIPVKNITLKNCNSLELIRKYL